MAAGNALERVKNVPCVILKKLVGVLSKYSYEIFLLHHVLISVSLSPYEQGEAYYSVDEYLLWALRVLVVIGIAAWMIYPRWKPQTTKGNKC
jgi:peptidoglycan/LPS O-acetylase OafA/YrhL